MVFSSLYYLYFFLPAFFGVYFLLKKRAHRNIALLIFSLFFYAWGEPVYIFLMLFSIAFNFLFGLGIGKAREEDSAQRAKALLVLSVIMNLALIGVFKYSGFFVNMLNGVFQTGLKPPEITLPIGISFYTFQIMSYVIDIYRKDIKPQKNVLYLGMYLCNFTHLVAGPIVRYRTIEAEIEERHENLPEIAEGMRRFTVGLAKKVLIANSMGAVSDALFKEPGSFGALGMWAAVVAYTLQIYYDFSGYSDMAIGMGRMMGFHYLENFNYPYISKSVGEFWRRWHISLSSFFRDYVYIPLGGNRVPVGRWILNMLAVWLLTGLWHGAGWTFVLWGVYFGILLIVEKLFLSKNILKVPVLNRIYTIAAFMFGWVIFRAPSVGAIGWILRALFGGSGAGSLADLATAGIVTPLYIGAAAVGIVCAAPVGKKIKELLEKRLPSVAAAEVASAVAVFACTVALATGSYNPFIYFRF